MNYTRTPHGYGSDTLIPLDMAERMVKKRGGHSFGLNGRFHIFSGLPNNEPLCSLLIREDSVIYAALANALENFPNGSL